MPGSSDIGQDVIAYQADGKIISVGSSQGYQGDFGVARYNPDGSLDATFGSGGTVQIDFGSHDFASSVAIDSAGRIIIGGYAYNGVYAFAVARLTTPPCST